MKILFSSFHLNGHTLGLDIPQTKTLDSTTFVNEQGFYSTQRETLTEIKLNIDLLVRAFGLLKFELNV